MAESIKLISRELRAMQFPEARFISKEEQARYEEACKSFGEKARANLKVNSNLFRVLLLNHIGVRTATIQELDLIVENAPDFLNGTYEDAPAVVLRSARDSYAPNDSLAKRLAKLTGKTSFSHAVVIEGLKPINDGNSNYGMSLEPTDKFRVIEAPDFDFRNNQRKFKRINADYTLEFDKTSGRTFYARDEGVAGVYLGRSADLYSSGRNLALSNVGGRVVVVSGEATSSAKISADSLDLRQYAEILKGVRAGTLPNSKLDEMIRLL